MIPLHCYLGYKNTDEHRGIQGITKCYYRGEITLLIWPFTNISVTVRFKTFDCNFKSLLTQYWMMLFLILKEESANKWDEIYIQDFWNITNHIFLTNDFFVFSSLSFLSFNSSFSSWLDKIPFLLSSLPSAYLFSFYLLLFSFFSLWNIPLFHLRNTSHACMYIVFIVVLHTFTIVCTAEYLFSMRFYFILLYWCLIHSVCF